MNKAAENMARDVCSWVKKHPSDFKALMRTVHHQVDIGNPRTRRDDIVSFARDMGMEVSVVDDLRHDHNLFAGLSRYMVMLRPRLARTLHFRPSKLDGIDLAAIWHEVVDPSTCFLAESWKQAAMMAETNDAAAA